MVVYFDASALLKLVIEEPGRDDVQALAAVATIAATARVTYPECHAALAAIRRNQRLNQDELLVALAGIQKIDDRLQVVELDRPLARHAGDLAERHGLRGFDAIHLATALTLQRPRHPVIFATWDRRLHQAAFDAGLTPAPAVL